MSHTRRLQWVKLNFIDNEITTQLKAYASQNVNMKININIVICTNAIDVFEEFRIFSSTFNRTANNCDSKF